MIFWGKTWEHFFPNMASRVVRWKGRRITRREMPQYHPGSTYKGEKGAEHEAEAEE